MTEITLSGITKRFGDNFVALQATDLTIKSGEFLTLLGPSGCGKTTTLRMIAGLETPSEGEILFSGSRVDRLPPGKRNVALVFQNYALYPHMTVRGNLEYPLKKRRVPSNERKQRLARISDTLHIEELLDRRPRQLSGGQQQRVALGRAMIRDPAVLLFDEPLSNLDAQLRSEMRAELVRLHENVGKTTIYVTHDQLEAMTMSDRIAVMYRGKIQQVDTPAKIYGRPVNRFVAGFVGTPSMNFVEGEMVAAGQGLVFRSEDGAVEVAATHFGALTVGRRVVMGVRPEHVEIKTGAMTAKVRMIENLGHEAQVALRRGKTEFVARTSAQHGLSLNDEIKISLKAEFLHIFDANDGTRIETDR